MFDTLIEGFKEILGLEHGLGVIIGLEHNLEITLGMVIRGLILYASTIFFIKLNKKFMSMRSTTNFILFIMLGSICATAITGDAPFISVLLTIIILMLINKMTAIIFFRYPQVEIFFTGEPTVLVNHGKIEWSNMAKHHITESNLLSALHTQLHTNDISIIDMAYLATDGTINFIVKNISA